MNKLNQHQETAIKQYSVLSHKLANLSSTNELDKLIEIIKVKKGWTSEAEAKFNQSFVQSIMDRIDVLEKDLKNCISSASLIK